MKNFHPIVKEIILSVFAGAVLGAILSLFSPGNFWLGWLGISTLCALCVFGTIRISRTLGVGRTLALLMLITFFARMVMGIFLYKSLPHINNGNPVLQSGYIFADAYERDQAAFKIAANGGLFKQELSEFRAADQYGGLLAVSALVYQIFSPDSHRPLLMVMLSAFAMTMGLAFLFFGISRKWGEKIALTAAWIYTLYPDGILLGSSQMREPILIGLTCLLFWMCLNWKEKPVRTLFLILLITLITCLFSVPAGGAAFTVVAGIVFVDWFGTLQDKKVRLAGIAIFSLFLGLAALAGWIWLKESLAYEYFMTTSSSGWITQLLENYGEQYKIPFITFYGLTQPVLPAAIVDPALPLSKAISIFRAAGWYTALPFILYGFLVVIKAKKEENRSLLVFLSLSFAAWTLIASLRGGGDQWDNPRYRATFLPWMAILIGWVWQKLRTQKCSWFWRIVAIEGVFVIFFLNWYINRHVVIGTQIPFLTMLLLIVGISIGIIFGGILWDLIKNRRKTPEINNK